MSQPGVAELSRHGAWRWQVQRVDWSFDGCRRAELKEARGGVEFLRPLLRVPQSLTGRPVQVIGIDVYPYPLPPDLPANLDFQVDDLNRPYDRVIAKAGRGALLTGFQVHVSVQLF